MAKKVLGLAGIVLAAVIFSGCVVIPREDPYEGMGPFERAVRQSPGYNDKTPSVPVDNYKDAQEKIERMNRGY